MALKINQKPANAIVIKQTARKMKQNHGPLFTQSGGSFFRRVENLDQLPKFFLSPNGGDTFVAPKKIKA